MRFPGALNLNLLVLMVGVHWLRDRHLLSSWQGRKIRAHVSLMVPLGEFASCVLLVSQELLELIRALELL